MCRHVELILLVSMLFQLIIPKSFLNLKKIFYSLVLNPAHREHCYQLCITKRLLPYLLKWAPRLQLFSGQKECGVYSRAATNRGQLLL